MKELHGLKMTEQKSQFMCHLYEIKNQEEVDELVKRHRSDYKKANHHCFAFRTKQQSGEVIEKSKNDGEVGHPGRVLAKLLEKYNLNNHAIIVSRIFGGVKLGVGGVSRAFREVGEETLKQWTSGNFRKN